MRALIIGGAGFVGSHLCDFLLDKGHNVVCLDNLITGSLDNISHNLKNKRFKFIKHDISKPIKISGRIDMVLNFASPASPIDYSKYPIETLKVGSLGTLNALGIARAKKARFLMASTSEVYGDPKVSPQKESYWGNVNPIGLRSCYDESKRFSEALVMAYLRTHKIDTKIIRIFNTYGPRMRINDGRVVPNFIGQALKKIPFTIYGKGDQTRSFCYIDDLILGIYRVIISRIHGPVNLGNPSEFTMIELAKLVSGLCSVPLKLKYKPLPKDDPKIRRPDLSYAKAALKWYPKVDLKDGLIKTIEYFKYVQK
ncbi:MAG: SDR family oxidoreductase [Candidatus Saganbacteria bacterium]|nr:SDR family oxidoreductase [Candidatus Saganbacteria bacterium]